MKKSAIILLLIPVIGFSQEAHRKLNFGLKIGPGIAWVSEDAKYISAGYERYGGGFFQFGLKCHKAHSQVFGFGSEVLIQAKTVGYRKRNHNVKTICLSGYCDRDDKAYFRHIFNSTSIDLNLYTTIHSGWGYASPYLIFGVNPSFLLSGKYKYNKWNTDKTIAKESWETGSAQFDPVSIGLFAGLGTKLVWLKLESMLDIRYLYYPNSQVNGLNSRIGVCSLSWKIFFNKRD